MLRGMRTIWKYDVPVDARLSVMMPRGGKVIAVQMQGDTPCLWAIVDSDEPVEQRRFMVFGTGHMLPDSPIVHLGTFQVNDGGRPLVFHVFEVVSP